MEQQKEKVTESTIVLQSRCYWGSHGVFLRFVENSLAERNFGKECEGSS